MDMLERLQGEGALLGKLRCLFQVLRGKAPQVGRLAIALYDEATDCVKTFLALEEPSNSLGHYHARLSETTWLLTVARSLRPRLIEDLRVLAGSRKPHVKQLLDAGYLSSYTLPMCVNGHFFGFIFFNARQAGAFGEALRAELDMLAHLLSLMVYQERMTLRTLQATLRSALGVSRVRDPESAGHLERMARYAWLIGHHLAADHQLSDEYVEHLGLFAPLHDLGKLSTPDCVLLKPGPLDVLETLLMREHPRAGLELLDELLDNFALGGVGWVQMLRNIVLYHHEALDGSGYPEGLVGRAIPLEARIVAVADVFDALTSERPYKQAWPNELAFSLLRQEAGVRLDEACVAVLLAHPEAVREIQQQCAESRFG